MGLSGNQAKKGSRVFKIVVRVSGPVKQQLRRLKAKTRDKGLANRCQIVLLRAEGETRPSIARAIGYSIYGSTAYCGGSYRTACL